MVIDVIDAVRNHDPGAKLRFVIQQVDKVGTGDQCNICTPAHDHLQVAQVGVRQADIEGIGQVLRIGVVSGKGIVITVKEREAFAARIIKKALLTPFLLFGHKHFRIPKAHIDRR